MRRVELSISQADCLRGTHLVVDFQRVTALAQLSQDILTHFSLDAHLVRCPLMMEMRLSKGRLDPQPKINRVDDGQERLSDNGRSAGRAHGQNGLAIL